MQSALARSEVPVARMHCLCEDESVIGRAFYVMEHVEGRIFWDQSLPEASVEERAAIYDELNRVVATLHRTDYASLGLANYGKPGNFFGRQIDRWTKQYRAAEDERIPAMDGLIEWLFVGAEGTLGIVTAAVMKLVPAPVVRGVAFCALEDEDLVLEFWMKLRAAAEGTVRAIEYLSGSCIELAKRDGLRPPVRDAAHYVLVELASSRAGADLKEMLEAFLAARLEDGTIVDAAIAQSGEQQKQIWRLREDHVGGRDVRDQAPQFEQQRNWRQAEHGEPLDLLPLHPPADLLAERGPQ